MHGFAVFAPLITPGRVTGQPRCGKRQQRSRAPGPVLESPNGTYVHAWQRAAASHVVWQSSAPSVLFVCVVNVWLYAGPLALRSELLVGPRGTIGFVATPSGILARSSSFMATI